MGPGGIEPPPSGLEPLILATIRWTLEKLRLMGVLSFANSKHL